MNQLASKNIVITRPGQQSENLARLVRERGGNPILFPAIAILPLENRQALMRIFSRLDELDLAIFISANAVNHSLPHLPRGWPAKVRCAAVGAGTLRALNAFGIDDVIAPIGGEDSEHLLETTELQNLRGKHIVIFRGEGGREWLKDSLQERGAAVEYVEVYRRAIPDHDAAPLDELWAKDELHAITVTSGEGLRNLFAMLAPDAQQRLRQTPIFASHRRIAAAAREQGCTHVVATSSGDEGLIAGLVHWFGTRI